MKPEAWWESLLAGILTFATIFLLLFVLKALDLLRLDHAEPTVTVTRHVAMMDDADPREVRMEIVGTFVVEQRP